MQIGTHFSLSDTYSEGVSCNESGVFVAGVPLLERSNKARKWQPRPADQLSRDLSRRYGVPIDFSARMLSLAAIAQALNRDDLIHAQIATLHLRIPDPPSPNEPPQPEDAREIVRLLRAARLLKRGWEPAKHPRWPAGTLGSIGGEFAPAESISINPAATDTIGPITTAQVIIPAPLDLPAGIPLPSEILPPPAVLDVYPRSPLRNPFPDKSDCEEEWAAALAYCEKLLTSGKMGKDGSRGAGKYFTQCVLGQVSERCGGSLTS